VTPIGSASDSSWNGGMPASVSRTNTKLTANNPNVTAFRRIARTTATRSGRPRSVSSIETAAPGRLRKATKQA